VRIASWLVGVFGGVAGLVLELWRFMPFRGEASSPLPTGPALFHLVLALLLAVSGVAIAIVARSSSRIGMVFLPLVGVLGLLLGVKAWAPAAALFIVAGGLCLLAHLRTAASPQGPAWVKDSDGTALHWSEAALRGIPATPQSHTRTVQDDPWSQRRKVWVCAIVVLVAAVVIPASLLPWHPTAQAAQTATARIGADATQTADTSSTGSTESSATGSTGETTTSTTAETSTTVYRVPSGFVAYQNQAQGFSMAYPKSWKETDYRKLGSNEEDEYAVVGFADEKGPRVNGEFLDFFQVDVVSGARLDQSMLPQLKQAMALNLQDQKTKYPDLKVIEPDHEVKVAGVVAVSDTCTFTLHGRLEQVVSYALIANGRIYEVQMAAVKEHWASDLRLFHTVIESFSVQATQWMTNGPTI
jgi:hypothetical protein